MNRRNWLLGMLLSLFGLRRAHGATQYMRALSKEEMLQLYNGGKGLKFPFANRKG
jgi:hypothetical protein